MNRSFLLRVYPTIVQQEQIKRTFGCCRFVYNYFLQKTKERWENEKKNYTYYEWYKDLRKLKQENDWLYLVDSHALVNSLQNLNCAYQRFFGEIKSGSKATYPRLKSKKQYEQSYRTSRCGTNIRVEGNKIKIPILGWLSCRNSYNDMSSYGKIVNATIKISRSGEYYVSIYCENIPDVFYEKTGESIGIDVGIKNMATLSNGAKYSSFHPSENYDKKLSVLQRRLSRKSVGGKNWDKQRKKVARHYEKMSRQRADYYHKITTEIVKKYDTVCLEDLEIRNLMRNKAVSKLIGISSWFEFKRQIVYKCKMHGKKVVLIDRFFPSSQICSCCGAKTQH